MSLLRRASVGGRTLETHTHTHRHTHNINHLENTLNLLEYTLHHLEYIINYLKYIIHHLEYIISVIVKQERQTDRQTDRDTDRDTHTHTIQEFGTVIKQFSLCYTLTRTFLCALRQKQAVHMQQHSHKEPTC